MPESPQTIPRTIPDGPQNELKITSEQPQSLPGWLACWLAGWLAFWLACWLLVAGCSLWLLVAGRWLLSTGYCWLLAACHSLLAAG